MLKYKTKWDLANILRKIETVIEDFSQIMFSCVYQWCKLLLEKNLFAFNFKILNSPEKPFKNEEYSFTLVNDHSLRLSIKRQTTYDLMLINHITKTYSIKDVLQSLAPRSWFKT